MAVIFRLAANCGKWMRAREFESELSALSFWSPSEIDQCTRQLRQAGLLPIGGRGLNAPDITPEHAALILIGLAAARRAADVKAAVQTYASMPALGEAFFGAETFARALTLMLSSWRTLRSELKIKGVVVCTTWPEAAVHFWSGAGEEQTAVYGEATVEHPGPGMRADVTFSPATLSMLALMFQTPGKEAAG